MDRMLEDRFFLALHDRDDAVCAAAASELAGTVAMRRLLETYAPLLKTRHMTAAATFFSNFVGGMATGLHYFLSVRNALPDFSLSNLTVRLVPASNGLYRFSFKPGQWTERSAPANEAERAEWLRAALSAFYGETVRPLFEAAADASGMRVSPLWAQLPARFAYFLEELPKVAGEAAAKRAAADYQSLRKLPPVVFNRSQNPFAVPIRRVESLHDAGVTVPMKSGCCLYHLVEGGSYCYTCPRLKEAERAAQREKFRASVRSADG